MDIIQVIEFLISSGIAEKVSIVGILLLWVIVSNINNRKLYNSLQKQAEINISQQEIMRSMSVQIQKSNSMFEDCKRYASYGKFWTVQHSPSLKQCSGCFAYDKCPHPRKHKIDISTK